MNKVLKQILLFTFSVSLIFFMGTVKAEAKDISVDNFDSLREALEEAATEATAENPYVITVTKSLSAKYVLRISSNTTLILKDGVTISQNDPDKNIIRVGEPGDENAKGYYYENITISGGVWDAKNGSSTAVKIAHAKNITLKNMTIKNVTDAHLMEVAGVDGFVMDNVTMMNMINDPATSKRYEAVQLDVLVESHFSGYSVYEDLPIKNVTITNCTFSNVPRGIGGHTGILNNPIQNISITNCKFLKNKSCAIQLFNAENVTITGNTISGSPRGIAILSAAYDNQDTYLASTLAAMGGVATDTPVTYVTPKENQGIVIQNNTITTSGTDPFASYESGAIWLNGKEVEPHETAIGIKGDDLPAGDYYISGVTISGNTINTSGFGVKICDVRNTKIYDNSFTCLAKKPSDGVYAFSVRENTQTTEIYNNKSTGFYKGTYVVDSSITSVSDNEFTTPVQYGIQIIKGNIDEIRNNTIKTPGINGIYLLNNGDAGAISGNTITSPKKYGVGIDTSCEVGSISNNEITKPGLNGIYVVRDSTASSIMNNTISTPTKYGIGVDSNATVSSISDNKITKPGVNGIFVLASSKVDTIEGNNIASPKKHGIGIDTKSVVGSINKNTVSSATVNGISVVNASTVTNIDGNKITSPKKHGITIDTKSTATSISKNNISKAGVNAIYVNQSSTVTNISSNTLKNSTKYGIAVDLKGYVKKINSNTITDSGTNGINIREAKADDVSKNTITTCGKTGIFVEKSTVKTMNSNKVSSTASHGITLFNKSKVTTFKSNTLTKCKGFGVIVGSDCKVSKKSGNKFKSCKQKSSGL